MPHLDQAFDEIFQWRGCSGGVKRNGSGFNLNCDPLPDHIAYTEHYNDVFIANPVITMWMVQLHGILCEFRFV
jgi:hypothetical protein